jgi:hypothetical protein
MLSFEAENYREEALALAREEAGRRKLDLAPSPHSVEGRTRLEVKTFHGPSLQLTRTLPVRELAGFRIALGVLALVIVVEALAWTLPGPSEAARRWAVIVAALVASLEYLRIVGRLHRALRIATDGRYPIGPVECVVLHFIPYFRYFWLFVWPARVARCAELNGRGRRFDRYVPGCLFLFACWAGSRSFASVQVALFFGTTWYVQHRLVLALARRPAAEGGPEHMLVP